MFVSWAFVVLIAGMNKEEKAGEQLSGFMVPFNRSERLRVGKNRAEPMQAQVFCWGEGRFEGKQLTQEVALWHDRWEKRFLRIFLFFASLRVFSKGLSYFTSFFFFFPGCWT